jgi:hypothetical protein
MRSRGPNRRSSRAHVMWLSVRIGRASAIEDSSPARHIRGVRRSVVPEASMVKTFAGPRSATVIRAWIRAGSSNEAMLDEQLALTVAWKASARSPAGSGSVSRTSMAPRSVSALGM